MRLFILWFNRTKRFTSQRDVNTLYIKVLGKPAFQALFVQDVFAAEAARPFGTIDYNKNWINSKNIFHLHYGKFIVIIHSRNLKTKLYNDSGGIFYGEGKKLRNHEP